jgi:C4-dicarboxylate transporter, DctM subunit
MADPTDQGDKPTPSTRTGSEKAGPPPSADSARSAEPAAAPAAASSSAPPPPSLARPVGPAWARPLAAVDTFITKVEEKLLLGVLGAEIGALVLWVFLRGFSYPLGDVRGTILRVAALAGLLSAVAAIVGRQLKLKHAYAPLALAAGGTVVGTLVAVLTRKVGIDYAENMLNWMQNASTLMLVGGLRGLVTRLTLWVALLGGSLATSKGKHINIDVVMRSVAPRFRLPLALVGWAGAILLCVTGAWGFVDQLAIGEFRVDRTEPCADNAAKSCEVGAGKKLTHLREEMVRDFFLLGRQASLDTQTIPKVLSGTRYDKWMTPKEWNAWMAGGNWEAHFKPEDVKTQLLADDATEFKNPQVNIPGSTENASGILVRDINLVLPFGLLMIALRFLLRMGLAVGGLVTVDPDAAHSTDDDEEPAHAAPVTAKDAKSNTRSLIIAGAAVVGVGLSGGLIAGLVVAMALLGTPLFAVMGGAAEIAWLRDPDVGLHHFRYLAPRILADEFAGSPILVTIPLFTFVGFVLAKANTAQRLVRFSTAMLGPVPGGLAIVAVLASAVFTLLTGGSGVTIISIGGLLMPALRKEGYSDKFSLGLLTSGGSLGLLLPLSLPLFIYSLVAGVDANAAMSAVIAPGMVVLAMFVAYAVFVGVREKIPTKPWNGREMLFSFWDLKWEALIPVIMAIGFKTLQLNIDEIAGVVAFYALIIETFVYRDITVKKDWSKLAKSSMAMAGAVILILTMANALVGYVIQVKLPDQALKYLLDKGLTQPWQFLLIMNVFLLLLGMVMEGFSAIFVAVPLVLPLAAQFHLGPFHVGMIFLLNLELAFCMPPLGLNLFIASFRFNRPATSLYRPILPFLGILTVALLLVSYVPSISNVMVLGNIRDARAKALKNGEAPRDAWLLECIQNDRLNPLPCTPEDIKAYPDGKLALPALPNASGKPVDAADAGVPDAGSTDDDDLMKQMMGGAAGAAVSDAGQKADDDDDIMKQMMGAGKDAAAPSNAPAPALETDDDIMKKMMETKP